MYVCPRCKSSSSSASGLCVACNAGVIIPFYPPDIVADQTIELAAARARIDELEAAIRAAIKHAEGNGMRDWKVFVALRKIII